MRIFIRIELMVKRSIERIRDHVTNLVILG